MISYAGILKYNALFDGVKITYIFNSIILKKLIVILHGLTDVCIDGLITSIDSIIYSWTCFGIDNKQL